MTKIHTIMLDVDQDERLLHERATSMIAPGVRMLDDDELDAVNGGVVIAIIAVLVG